MLGNLTGWHALIILAVVILLFGATKLPALARSMGQSMKIFRNEMKSDTNGQPRAQGDDSASTSDAAETTQNSSSSTSQQ